MDKRLLLKYVAGEATSQEVIEVLDWAEQSQENKQYLITLKLDYVASAMPQSTASEQEMEQMRKRILQMETSEQIDKDFLSRAAVESGSMQDSSRQNISKQNRTHKIITYTSLAVAAIAIIAFILKPTVPTGESLKQFKNDVIAQLTQEELRIKLAGVPQERVQTVYTEKGVKSKITLPDGSQVMLNSHSKITFPDKFAGPTREVELSGEAYFKVQGDSLCPMIVSTSKGFQIKVLGTEFNVKSYENDQEAQTTLYTGSICLVANGAEKSILPNEQAVISAKNEVKIITPTIVPDTKAWTEGRLIFDETPVSEVVKMLERWHGVKTVVKDPKILKYKITAEFKSESIYQIMHIIKSCSLIDYTIEESTVFMSAR